MTVVDGDYKACMCACMYHIITNQYELEILYDYGSIP